MSLIGATGRGVELVLSRFFPLQIPETLKHYLSLGERSQETKPLTDSQCPSIHRILTASHRRSPRENQVTT
jgi:hypothetical protein